MSQSLTTINIKLQNHYHKMANYITDNIDDTKI